MLQNDLRISATNEVDELDSTSVVIEMTLHRSLSGKDGAKLNIAQISLGSSRHVSTRHDMYACRAVLVPTWQTTKKQ